MEVRALKNLYLHIGYPKTGTTSIQSFMAKNTAALMRRGILYPETGRMHDAHYGYNFSLGIGKYDGTQKLGTPEQLLAELKKEVERSGCENIVISSEYFILTRAQQKVKDFFADYNVKIVVYLRRHDHAFESAFAQSEKTTPNPPWEPNISSYTLHAICSDAIPYDYLNILLRWREFFGKGNIIVRPYEKQQNTPDLFADFLRITGIEDAPEFARPGTVNSSISREALQSIRIIQGLKLSPALKNKVLNRVMSAGASTGNDKYFSPEMRNVVIRKYTPAYKAIAREFLGRADGVLFKEAIPKAGDPWTPPQPPNVEQILNSVIEAMAPLAE